jgi:hypothetical protein
MDKHSGGISKGAEASPQPKQTNKQWNFRKYRKIYQTRDFSNPHLNFAEPGHAAA